LPKGLRDLSSSPEYPDFTNYVLMNKEVNFTDITVQEIRHEINKAAIFVLMHTGQSTLKSLLRSLTCQRPEDLTALRFITFE